MRTINLSLAYAKRLTFRSNHNAIISQCLKLLQTSEFVYIKSSFAKHGFLEILGQLTHKKPTYQNATNSNKIFIRHR